MIADLAGHAIQNGVEIIGRMNSTTQEHVAFLHLEGEGDLHFDFNDQSNVSHNCVSAVVFSRDGVTIQTKNLPDGSLTVTVPDEVENREDVKRRLAEIIAMCGVTVTTQ